MNGSSPYGGSPVGGSYLEDKPTQLWPVTLYAPESQQVVVVARWPVVLYAPNAIVPPSTIVWPESLFAPNAQSYQPAFELITWPWTPTTSNDFTVTTVDVVPWPWTLFVGETLQFTGGLDIRDLLVGYTFDGTSLAFPLTAIPGLTSAHAAELTGDVRYFIWYWLKRVWAWEAARTYVHTLIRCMPIMRYYPESGSYVDCTLEQYQLLSVGTAFSSSSWSSRSSANPLDENLWKIENLFPGWECDGSQITIPLVDLIGLSSADADTRWGDANHLIHAIAQNLYDWSRKLGRVTETIQVNQPRELYNDVETAWQCVFDVYLYTQNDSLSLGELVAE